MAASTQSDVTKVLLALQAGEIGDGTATDKIFELVYDELRRLAAGMMRAERAGHTLQPTALVHEAYCNLVDQTRVKWQNRAHFFGIAARAMRRILVSHARKKAAAKRGGDRQRITLDDRIGAAANSEAEVLALDEALDRMAHLDERMARVVELRVFSGLKAEEVAHVLGVSRRTVLYDWKVAKLWLRRELASC